jgi:hypothetical protein
VPEEHGDQEHEAQRHPEDGVEAIGNDGHFGSLIHGRNLSRVRVNVMSIDLLM